MRDRAQQGRLDEVAAAKRLRFERLLLETAPVERNGEQRGERRQEAAPHGRVGLGIDGRVDRPDHAAVDLEARRCVPALAALPAELDLGARHAEHLGGPAVDPGELLLDRRAAEQVLRDLGEERRLALALLGFLRAAPRPRGELADDHGRQRVRQQREPVRRVAQRERVHRRQEEEVEREHARDRDRQRPADAQNTATGSTASM